MKRSSGMRAPRLDRPHEVARRQRAPAFPRGDLRLPRGQAEDVGRAVQPAVVVEFRHRLLAQAVDVEGGAGDEMDQPLDHLRRADQAAGAAAHHLARRAHGEAAADRAVVGEDERRRAAGRPVRPPPRRPAGSRRRRAGAARCRRCGCPCGRSRPRCAGWRAATSTPPTFTGSSSATGVSAPVRPTWMRIAFSTVVACSAGNFHADRPARRAADEAEPLLQGQIVDLVDHAVDVVVRGRRARRPSRPGRRRPRPRRRAGATAG